MDHYSILDQSPSSSAMEGDMPASSASKSAASVSAGIAAANAHPAKPPEPAPRFPGEDAGRSLAEMAYRDLDAALQLLAERGQYITGANGAAIALRRGDHNDMLCRASSGSNAPELGALLSMEYGLSGESVRTRQVLRCDDTERDPRVNHEVCRALGISSVVVMPISSDEHVLGVFELLSDKPRAFTERDLLALARLSEMVQTAVKHAVAAQSLPTVKVAVDEIPVDKVAVEEVQPLVEVITAEASQPESSTPEIIAVPAPADPAPEPAPVQASAPVAHPAPEKKEEVQPAPRKPLFWSAAMRPVSGEPDVGPEEARPVPPVLRNLRKCQACGFPVSQARTFCVECEEKQWRGQRLSQPATGPQRGQPTQTKQPIAAGGKGTFPQLSPQTDTLSQPLVPVSQTESIAPPTPAQLSSNISAETPAFHNSPSFMSMAQSESWFAANKYILAALLIVAIVVTAIAWLR
jgi:GAF domain